MHCCVCTGACGHTGGPSYCAQHGGGTPSYIQDNNWLGGNNLGWKCPGCGACYSPLIAQCFCCTGVTKTSITQGVN